HVSQWQEVYDDLYGRDGDAGPADFNIVGWTDSITGAPIEEAAMREWRDGTVRRIRALGPKRLLEIGCGTGLLLHRLAPGCERYTATDLSQAALDLIAAAPPAGHVHLVHAAANDFSAFDDERWDVVVLNSVAQYFPSAEYLEDVIARAAERVAPGGAIFLGDPRSLPLATALWTEIEMQQASEALDRVELQRRIRRRARAERELLIDPRFFRALQARIPRISQVLVELREGQIDNELTRYRYDVVLYLDTEPSRRTAVDHGTVSSIESIRQTLESDTSADHRFVTTNRRVARETLLADLVAGARRNENAGELRRAVATRDVDGVHPQALWDLARHLGWRAVIRSGDDPAEIEVLFTHTQDGTPIDNVGHDTWEEGEPLTNRPLAARAVPALEQRLHRRLQERLPEHMQLSAIVFVDEFPLAPNGKVDRGRLPAPEREAVGEYRAPANPVEEQLAAIWCEVLGVDRIGTSDDFFDLGGHSLLATQLVSRVRQTYGATASVRTLFEHPTIEEFARTLDARQQAAAPASPGMEIVAVPRDGRLPASAAQQRLWLLDRLEKGDAAYN